MSAIDILKIGAGILAGAALMAVPAYLQGRASANSDARAAALAMTVEVLEQRSRIDVEISTADAADLCRHFGLLGKELTECVRRLGKTAAEP